LRPKKKYSWYELWSIGISNAQMLISSRYEKCKQNEAQLSSMSSCYLGVRISHHQQKAPEASSIWCDWTLHNNYVLENVWCLMKYLQPVLLSHRFFPLYRIEKWSFFLEQLSGTEFLFSFSCDIILITNKLHNTWFDWSCDCLCQNISSQEVTLCSCSESVLHQLITQTIQNLKANK